MGMPRWGSSHLPSGASREGARAEQPCRAVLRSHLQFFKDKVHPGKVFRGLWADVLLFKLRELYIRSRASIQRGRGEQGVLRR